MKESMSYSWICRSWTAASNWSLSSPGYTLLKSQRGTEPRFAALAFAGLAAFLPDLAGSELLVFLRGLAFALIVFLALAVFFALAFFALVAICVLFGCGGRGEDKVVVLKELAGNEICPITAEPARLKSPVALV